MDMFSLEGKVALVTGASSGLGRSAAIAYAKAGADVSLFARRVERLEEVAKEIEALGRKALVVSCDVTETDQIKSGVEKTIEEFGQIDILLNNAGIAQQGDVIKLTEEEWQRSMDINVKSIYLMTKYVVPHMQDKEYGKIINVASMNAVIADKSEALYRHVYNTSKAAVRGLTMGLAASYGKHNITVNSVGPGLFESEMTEGLLQAKDWVDFYTSVTPLSRQAKEGELNGTLIYLSSDASSYVTGQHILIDGGFTIV